MKATINKPIFLEDKTMAMPGGCPSTGRSKFSRPLPRVLKILSKSVASHRQRMIAQLRNLQKKFLHQCRSAECAAPAQKILWAMFTQKIENLIMQVNTGKNHNNRMGTACPACLAMITQMVITNKLEKILNSVKQTSKKAVDFCKNNYKVGVMLGAGLIGGYGAEKVLTNTAKADTLKIEFKNNTGQSRSISYIKHTTGATEDYGYGDASSSEPPSPGLWIYSASLDPNKLGIDARPTTSMTSVNVPIYGLGLSGSVSNELKFTTTDSLNEHVFDNKNITGELYDSENNFIGSYDLKSLASTGTTIPITINNGKSYVMNIKFEPNKFGINELADLAENWLQTCDNSNNKCAGLGEDGKILNFIDFAYWAKMWNPNN